MPLGAAVGFHIEHRQAGTVRLPWATTYAAVAVVEEAISYATAQEVLRLLGLAEQPFYYSNIRLTGGAARTFRAKTTVPDPTPPPYDPSEHVSATFDYVGTRSLDGQQLYYDQVIDIERVPEYGNIGHIELRGALAENDVDQSLSFRTLTTSARSTFDALVAAFQADLTNIEDDNGIEFRLISQPLLSTSWAIGSNGKPKATRTYGAASFRDVVSWGVGLVRTDKGHNRYFDHDV